MTRQALVTKSRHQGRNLTLDGGEYDEDVGREPIASLDRKRVECGAKMFSRIGESTDVVRTNPRLQHRLLGKAVVRTLSITKLSTSPPQFTDSFAQGVDGLATVGAGWQGYDLQLTQYDERGWRATFYATGLEHSPTSATGTGWERRPWHATQRAAREALSKARPDA